jgi:hypothetical protein
MSAASAPDRESGISSRRIAGRPPNVPLLTALTTPVRQATPVVAAVVRAASVVRGARVIHGRGRTVAGRLRMTGGDYGAVLLDTEAEYDVVVRLSRSAGLPAPLPDVHGLAIRVPDVYGPGRHQDILLDSTVSLPLLRRWPVPAMRPRLYGSLLSLEIGGSRRLLGARRDGDCLELLVASPYGVWEAVGQLELGTDVSHGRSIRFNVWNTGGGIRPVGAIQEWRRQSYEASRVGQDA